MSPALKYLLLFLAGLLACPPFICLHELRHYAAALALGASSAHVHYAQTTFRLTNTASTSNVLICAAGPVGDAALAAAGLLWLYCRRRHCRDKPATRLDWCVTIVAFLHSARWLRGFGGSPAHPQPNDEAFLSLALGMPSWLLPYLLAVLCCIPVVMIIRLHPPRARCLPFLSLVLGSAVGGALWIFVIGPRLLP